MKYFRLKRLQFCNLFVIIDLALVTNCNHFRNLRKVILIFKGFDIGVLKEKLLQSSTVLKLTDFAKANRIKIKYVSLALVGILSVTAALLSAGVTVGVKVNYSGKDIAVVKSESVFDSALNIATKNIADDNAEKAIQSPKFSLTLTVADRFQNAAGLAETIIENTGDLAFATAIKVDGQTVAVVAEDEIEEYIESRRTAFFVDGAENTAEFVSSVETEDGYFLKSEISDIVSAKAIVDKLEVKTVSVIKTKSTIPYKTVKKTTSKEMVGYKKVTVAGCNGTAVKSESVETINGKKVSRTVISDEIVTKPVDKVVVIGTGVKKISSSSSISGSSSGLICPIAKGKFVVSAYFGDGRNHKAVDLSADRGTPIYAAGGGTVTYAGYDSDFGYNVIIKHSNGISTRYAHANSLSVSRGQVVSQGDMIGTVGSTGWSTGNHLHFEVIVNGVRVNPAPYIGM